MFKFQGTQHIIQKLKKENLENFFTVKIIVPHLFYSFD